MRNIRGKNVTRVRGCYITIPEIAENQKASRENIDFFRDDNFATKHPFGGIENFPNRRCTSRKFPDLISRDARGTFRESYVRMDSTLAAS